MWATTLSRGRWKVARHLAILDREIVRVIQGRERRLIVEMPPRHGKSELTSRYTPAHYLCKHPERKIIFGSATQDLADQFSGFARDQIVEHGAQFGVALGTKTSAKQWNTNKRGEVRATGVGGSVFGFGADLAIIDDYCGSIESAMLRSERDATHRWFHGTIRNRMESEKSAIIIVATRYHKDDLVGRLLKEQGQGGDQWRRISLPAIASNEDELGRRPGEALWPLRWSRQYLDREQRAYAISGYPWMFDALYQCEPTDVLSSEWPGEYFGDHLWFDEWPHEQDIAIRVMAIDPSLGRSDKSDYSAIIMLAVDKDGYCWVDADLARRSSALIARDAMARQAVFKANAIGCETNQFQELLGGEFDRASGGAVTNGSLWFVGINNHVNKLVRIRGLTPLLDSRRLRVKRGSPGCNLLVEQMRGFPDHKYDDGPDALEMAVRMAREILEGRGAI